MITMAAMIAMISPVELDESELDEPVLLELPVMSALIGLINGYDGSLCE